MKTRKFSLALAIFLLVSAAFVSSCRKKSTEEKDTDTSAATDNNLAESTSNDVVNMAGQASENSNVAYRGGNDEGPLSSFCVSYWKRDTIRFVDSVAFSGGVCADGRSRSGSITFTYGAKQNTMHYRTPGFTCTVKTYNYVVDGNHITLTKTITNNSPNSGGIPTGNLTWNVTANATIVKAGNGGTITWSCNRNHTLLNTSAAYTIGGASVPACYNGANLPITWSNAVLSFSGTASGTTAKGGSYSLTGTNLILNMTCSDVNHPNRHPFVEGTIDFTPSGKATRHVDFGNGTCDMQFTVTINGTTYGPYTMP